MAEEKEMHAEVEREEQGGGSQTASPPKPAPNKPRTDHLPRWKVILHNDDVNDVVYVVQTIMALTHMTFEVAKQRMLEAHTKGLALLLTTHQERAELYRDQFTSKRLTVTIEEDV